MSKQVILIKAVGKLGAEGDAVTVSDGYARNYLVPQGFAITATPGNLKRIESLRKKRAQELAGQMQDAQSLSEKLAGHSLTIPASAGPDGKLFGSVTAARIATALKAEGIEIDRHKIVMEHPLHELGAYDVEVKLHPDVTGKVKVWIVSDGAATPTSAPAEEPATKPREAKKKK